MINGLDLFSGIGGLSLALREWIRPIAYCENDRYAQGVLLSRMQSGDIGVAPIWDDVRNLRSVDLYAKPDIIYGGFPCQDISAAGLGAGLGGQRSGLFFEVLRLAKEIKPNFIFLENVPAIRTRGLEHVAEGISSAGYDCRWDFVSAEEMGAPHKRNRWFLLAHANGLRLREKQRAEHGKREGQIFADDNGETQSLADSSRELSYGRAEPTDASWWQVEPNVGRVADGIPARVDRLRGLGNAVVPLQAKEAFMRLAGLT